MYFTMRAACPEFFTNRDMSRPELRELMTNGLVAGALRYMIVAKVHLLHLDKMRYQLVTKIALIRIG